MASVTLSPTGASGTGWSNPSRVTASDDSRASITVAGSGGTSSPLSVSFPSAGLNAGDIIDGILVEVEGDATGSGIRLSGGSAGVTLPKGSTKTDATGWSLSGDSTYSLGGSSDLWGGTWSASDFNSTWSLSIRVSNSSWSSRGAYIDYVSVTIYYHAGSKDISATATQAQTGTVNLGVQRPLAATATQAQTGTVNLGVTRPISATATQAQTGTVALGVKRPISASASQDQTGTVALGHAKTISASAAQGQTGTVTITVNNPISATATQDQTGTVNLTVTRPISASASQGQTGTVNITVATTWTISSSATQDQTGTATLGVKRPLATLGEQPQAGTVNLGVQRSISAAATQLFSGSVAITVFAPITYVHKLRLSLAEADILRASPQSPLLRAVGNDPFTRQHHASPLTRVQGNDPVLRVQQE